MRKRLRHFESGQKLTDFRASCSIAVLLRDLEGSSSIDRACPCSPISSNKLHRVILAANDQVRGFHGVSQVAEHKLRPVVVLSHSYES